VTERRPSSTHDSSAKSALDPRDPLERARSRVAHAERHVASQLERVQRLRLKGYDTTQAETLLTSFEAVLVTALGDLEYELKRS
jgi:hypothetical protein